MPISLRLTSASGKQVVLNNFITSLSSFSTVDTKMNYGGSSATAPTAPTTAPTTRPSSTGRPSSSGRPNAANSVPDSSSNESPSPSSSSSSSPAGSVSISQHDGTNAWWFSVSVSGMDSVASVELKVSIMSSPRIAVVYLLLIHLRTPILSHRGHSLLLLIGTTSTSRPVEVPSLLP